MAVLTDDDKSRVRYHLEYPDIKSLAQSVQGLVINLDIQFQLEAQMNNLADNAVPRVVRVLDILDDIETRMSGGALDRLQASKADVVVLNENEIDQLQATYSYWQTRLSKQFFVPVNPHAVQQGMRGLNARLNR